MAAYFLLLLMRAKPVFDLSVDTGGSWPESCRVLPPLFAAPAPTFKVVLREGYNLQWRCAYHGVSISVILQQLTEAFLYLFIVYADSQHY